MSARSAPTTVTPSARGPGDTPGTSEDWRPSRAASSLGFALVLVALGALGAWPDARGEPDPVALIVWLSIVAVPIGVGAGARGLELWPWAALVPAAWMGVIGIADGLSRRDLPAPAHAALALAGAFALGFALGRAWPRAGWRIAAALLLALAGLAALPLGAPFLEFAPSSAARGLVLDVSPVTFVAECAGLDWLRQPVVYDALQTADIEPATRAPWSGALAGAIAFVVGSLAAFVAEHQAKRARPTRRS